MKRQTTATVGLLVTLAVLLLTSVTANPSEEPESSVSPLSPSSQSPTDTEVPPEQRFIELSRTKALSNSRRRPASRRSRPSKTPPSETQNTPAPPAETNQSPSTQPVSEVISTSQLPVTTPESVTTTRSAERPDIANKRVRFTKTRATKSNRGQVFTFTFKNHEHNSAKEKQHTQSKIPARYSSAFTTQTPKRRGSLPEAPTETNQPDNVAINPGPPGDVPRARHSGRELNLSVVADQRNHISQSQNLEAKTSPESFVESTTPNNILPSFRPKLKNRPDYRQGKLLNGVEGTTGATTQPAREENRVNERQNLAVDDSSPASRPQRPLKEGLQVDFPNQSSRPDELPTPSPTENLNSQGRNSNEGQSITDFAPPQKVRYVKAGSLRFLPNRPSTPEDVQVELSRNFARPTVQTINDGQSISEPDNYPQGRRPNSQYRPLRPETDRFLQESPASQKNVSPEEIRNYVEPTPQTSTLSEERGSPERDNLQAYRQPEQLLKQESPRFTPKEPHEIPPELARDFANLQTFIGIRNSERFNSQTLQRLNTESQPLNTKPQKYLPENPTFAQELPAELRKKFADTTLRPVAVNEEQYHLPPSFSKQYDRPTKADYQENVPNTSENLEGLPRQSLQDFARPTGQTLRVNPEQDQVQSRLQELPRPTEPLKERLAIFVPIGAQGLPSQLPRDFADPNLVRLIQSQGQEPIRQELLRPNRPLNADTSRFLSNDPRVLSFQPASNDAQSHTLQEPQQSDRPLNAVSARIFPDDPQRPRSQSIRDFADPNLVRLIQSQGQEPIRQELPRPNRPLNADTSRFLPNDPRGFPSQPASNDAQSQTLQEPQQSDRPLNADTSRFLPNDPRGFPSQPASNDAQSHTLHEPPQSDRPLNADSSRFLSNNPRVLSFQPASNDAQSQTLQEPQQSDRSLNALSARIFPNDLQRPRSQSIRDFVDPNLQTFRENEEQSFKRQEFLRSNRPLTEEVTRLLQNNAQRLLPQSINFADQNIQNLLERERQGLARFSSSTPTKVSRPPLEPERILSNEQVFVGQNGPRGLDNTDVNYRNERPVNGRLPEPSPDSPIRSQIFDPETAINSPKTLAERPLNLPSNTPLSHTRLQENEQVNAAQSHSEQSVPRPTEPTIPPSTVQPKPQTTTTSPGIPSNPLGNGPRLIIEFPSPSSGDQSIRLQLNPNAAPAGPAVSPQPSAPRISNNIPTTPATADTSNQPNSQTLPTNSVAGSPVVSQLPAQISPVTAPTEPSVEIQSDLQTSPSNAGLASNSHVSSQQSRPLTNPVQSDNSASLQLNQQTPKSKEIAGLSAQSNLLQSTAHIASPPKTDSTLHDQPKTLLFPVNPSPNTPRLPTSNSSPVAPNSLQLKSQTQQSQSPSTISPLSKTIPFNSQLSSPQSSTLLNSPTSLQNSLSNPTQTFKSDLRPVQQLTAVTRDSPIQLPLNSQAQSNVVSSVNSLSDNPVSSSEIQATAPPVALQPSTLSETNPQNLTEAKSPVKSSLKSEESTAESKPSVTESPPKPNAQAPPVDLRLTINFNSNIPGFLQQTSSPTQNPGSDVGSSNNTQLTTSTTPPTQPSAPPSDFSNRPQFSQQFQSSTASPQFSQQFQSSTASPQFSQQFQSLSPSSQFSQQFQPATASPISSPAPNVGIPFGLQSPVNNSPLRSQSDFQASLNFRPDFNPQIDVRGQSPITQSSLIRTQPFSQFLNANAAGPVNTQFNTFGNQLNLRAPQSPSLQEQLSRYYQNSQFSSPSIGSFINSQFNIPGRPFEVQNQQTPNQDVLSRYQSQSQFQNTNARDINSQFNNFGTLPSQSQQPPLTRVTPTRLEPVQQGFTSNAGIAVNSLSFSPGLPVELLPPPVTGDSSANSKRSEMSTTIEQPRVSFLVNSPELSADLLPPVVSQSSVSAQPSTFQPVQPTSPRPSVTLSSSTGFDLSPQFAPANIGRVPEPPIELLPPLDPFFPQLSQNPNIGLPPNPIDIPKPDVPALVPPPREKIATPIDIPRPDVPALVPPPRERVETPIDIPKPDVPALVPPPREHIITPIDIPRPDVPALVPPPRPSDLARLLPPAPTTFTFNPPDVSQQQNAPNSDIPFNPNTQTNPQSQQTAQTSSDNPVLILPKSSSRQQGRLNNPLSIEDLSKRVGFLPQSQPAPFSISTQSSGAQTKTDSVFQITDIRAGRLQPIAQEVITSGTPSQLAAKSNPASSQTDVFKTPISVSLQAPLLTTSVSNTQQQSFGSVLNNEQTKTVGQTSIDQRLGSTIQTPTQTLLPPVGQEFTPTAAVNPSAFPSQPLVSQTSTTFGTTSPSTPSTEPPTVNIVPPKPKNNSPLGQAKPPAQPPQEGFIIFQSPSVTVTSQTNGADSQINVTVITQGGTGHMKPNTTLTAEPIRPPNITESPDSHLFVSQPPSSTPTLPDLPSTLLPPLNERTSLLPINNLPSLNSGSVRNNFTFNPFTPPSSQPFLTRFTPFRFSNASLATAPGSTEQCPKLELRHKGHRAPQITGNLILSPGFYPIDEPNPSRCDSKFVLDGKKLNWWQILLNNGGEPSTLSRENESEDARIPPLRNPCARPFETEGVPVFYNTTKTDSRTYYREEIAYHRFPESKNTFLESRGLFVSIQAKSAFDSTAYLVLYTRDDSGFWLEVKNVNCQFNKNVQPNLQCQSVPECFCIGGQKRCTPSVPVLTRNFPLKTFRF